MLPLIKNGFERNKRRNNPNFLVVILMLFSYPIASQTKLSWHFYQADIPNVTYQLGEKGSVQKTFRDLKILPDPFVGMNENKYGWIENKDWVFESEFTMSEADLKKDFVDLHFRNIDTYATIYVNNVKVGQSESAFIPYSFEIKHLLKTGKNTIRLHFVSPINFHKKEYQSLKVKYPTPNDANDTLQVVSMSRKPQFQFGWDWSLRMTTMGFNEPAFIEAYNFNRILQTSVQTVSITTDSAIMQLNVVFRNPVDRADFRLENLHIRPENIRSDIGNLDNRTIQVTFTIKNPKLYWPRGYGEQFLYRAPLKIYLKNHLIANQDDFYFGIAKKSINQAPDQYGTPFEIHWNNQFVFCKGGDYIPQDVFLSKVTEERMKTLIDQCVESNFNMIRIWGGGYYLPDFFYRYCAEKGIMIWQDFMFACSLYPGDQHFLNLVQQEARYQIPRISTHPNIAIFNGNNEVMVAGKYWGFKQKYHIDSNTQEQFDQNYNRLFKGVLANEVQQWSTIPYIHTSPLSHWGKDEWYKNGTQHYWGVWHGSDPMEDMARKSGRFNAEYGFQSFPEYSTWLKISDKSQWNLDNEVIKQHQKSYVGNGMILKQATLLYGKPKDFEDFVYLSQLTQSKAVSLAISSQRLQYPRVAGTLYWQINDCWPVSSWSSIDYYGNWKALQYRVKEDFEDIAILENLEGNTYHYYLFSDALETKNIRLKMNIYDLNGKEILKKETEFKVAKFQKIPIDFSSFNLKTDTPYLVDFAWNDGRKELKRSFILNEKSYQRNEAHVAIKEIKKLSDNKIELIIENELFSAYTWITSIKGNIFLPENFIHLLPGKHKITIDYQGEVPQLEDFDVKNL